MKLIAFLRAINVGGHVVKMDRLRALFEQMGMEHVETFIASGNVIFDTRRRDAARLEQEVEKHLKNSLGYEVATFMRTPAEVAAVSALQPFGTPAANASLYIGFIRSTLDPEAAAKVLSFRTDIDDFHVSGREVYWLSSGRMSDSKFSNAAMERALGTRATFRNITTVSKLAAKYAAD